MNSPVRILHHNNKTLILLFNLLSMTIKNVFIALVFCFCFYEVNAQDAPVYPTMIGKGVFLGETPPLRDLPALSPEEYQAMVMKAQKKLLNQKLKFRSYPFKSIALPNGPDPAWQKTMGTADVSRGPMVNFGGQSTPSFPPDCNGTVGPDHFMQKMVGFNNAWRPSSIDGFMCVPPVDNDGTFAPAGSPGLFIAFNDDAIAGGSDQLWIYELAREWYFC